MKNLKKVLSLALAFAMVLGLCIGASAAQDVTTLTDWNEVENKDAATLLNAFNIMQGNTDGTFAPNANVKRCEAAKMISVALWGGSDDVALYSANNYGGYTDTPAGAWYMGYVNYLSAIKVMAGKGEGKFDPEGTVTGYELLKMCLVSLGYNPETEGLVGAGWDVKAMALATNPSFHNLTAGTKVENWNAALSRMNAATIIANMIKRNTVSYDLTSGVGGTISSKIKPSDKTFAQDYLKMTERTGTLVANESGSIGTIVTIDKNLRSYKGENAIVNLKATYKTGTDGKPVVDLKAEPLNLVLDSTADQLGNQVKAYYKDGRFIYAAISASSEVEPSFNALTNAMTNDERDTDGKTDIDYYVNGTVAADMTGIYTVDKGVMTVEDNASVKFLDTNGNGYIDTIVAFTYGANEIKADNTKIKEAGDGYTLNNAKKVLKTACDFEAAKGDKIMVVELTNCFGGKVQHGYVMETVEGKVTRASADGKTLYIDGVKYTNNNTIEGLSIDSEGTFWLYANGNIQSFVGTKTAAAGPDGYALVYKAGFEKTGTATTIGGKENITVQVAAVLPDGTDKIFDVAGVVETETKTENGKPVTSYKTEVASKLVSTAATPAFAAYKGLNLGGVAGDTPTNEAMLVPYSLNDEGEINLYAEVIGGTTKTKLTSTGIKTGTANVATDDDTKYLTADSIVYVQTEKDDETAKTTEKWVVYKGLTVPTFTVEGANKTDVVVGDRFATGDGLKISYVLVNIDNFKADSEQESPLFAIMSDPMLVAKDTYEAKIYDGSTNKTETVTYKVTGNNVAGAKGEMYKAFNTSAGFVSNNKIPVDLYGANMTAGFITSFEGSVIRIATYTGATETANKVYTVSKDAKYYLIDGEDTTEIKASDIAAQDAGTTNQYQTVVVKGTNEVVTVIVFADVQGLAQADQSKSIGGVTTIGEDFTALIASLNTVGEGNELKMTKGVSAKLDQTGQNAFTLTLSGTDIEKLTVGDDYKGGFTVAQEQSIFITLNFGACAKGTSVTKDGNAVGKTDDAKGNIVMLLDWSSNAQKELVCNGVTLTIKLAENNGFAFKTGR